MVLAGYDNESNIEVQNAISTLSFDNIKKALKMSLGFIYMLFSLFSRMMESRVI